MKPKPKLKESLSPPPTFREWEVWTTRVSLILHGYKKLPAYTTGGLLPFSDGQVGTTYFSFSDFYVLRRKYLTQLERN